MNKHVYEISKQIAQMYPTHESRDQRLHDLKVEYANSPSSMFAFAEERTKQDLRTELMFDSLRNTMSLNSGLQPINTSAFSSSGGLF